MEVFLKKILNCRRVQVQFLAGLTCFAFPAQGMLLSGKAAQMLSNLAGTQGRVALGSTAMAFVGDQKSTNNFKSEYLKALAGFTAGVAGAFLYQNQKKQQQIELATRTQEQQQRAAEAEKARIEEARLKPQMEQLVQILQGANHQEQENKKANPDKAFVRRVHAEAQEKVLHLLLATDFGSNIVHLKSVSQSNQECGFYAALNASAVQVVRKKGTEVNAKNIENEVIKLRSRADILIEVWQRNLKLKGSDNLSDRIKRGFRNGTNWWGIPEIIQYLRLLKLKKVYFIGLDGEYERRFEHSSIGLDMKVSLLGDSEENGLDQSMESLENTLSLCADISYSKPVDIYFCCYDGCHWRMVAVIKNPYEKAKIVVLDSLNPNPGEPFYKNTKIFLKTIASLEETVKGKRLMTLVMDDQSNYDSELKSFLACNAKNAKMSSALLGIKPQILKRLIQNDIIPDKYFEDLLDTVSDLELKRVIVNKGIVTINFLQELLRDADLVQKGDLLKKVLSILPATREVASCVAKIKFDLLKELILVIPQKHYSNLVDEILDNEIREQLVQQGAIPAKLFQKYFLDNDQKNSVLCKILIEKIKLLTGKDQVEASNELGKFLAQFIHRASLQDRLGWGFKNFLNFLTVEHFTIGQQKIRDLIFSGLPINMNPTGDHETPLKAAISIDDFELAELLLQRGALVNYQNNCDNETPLGYVLSSFWLISKGKWINFLLKNGADPYIKNKNGKNAFDLAENQPNILTILHKWEADKKSAVMKKT